MIDEEILKQFCTFGISKELKDLGFDKYCLGHYYGESFINTNMQNHDNEKITAAPLWLQAVDFLREKYQIIVEPTWDFLEARAFDVALIQEDEISPAYLSTDILGEPSLYRAYELGIKQAVRLIKDGTMDFVQFENWFDKVLELWSQAGMYHRIQLDKDSARMQFDLGSTPEQFVDTAKEEFE